MGKWKARRCKHCNNFVERDQWALTGWTHVGDWEGTRCQNALTRAEPKN